MSEQPVTFLSGGQQVVGMFHLPENASRCPAIVMFHGFTGSKHETRRLFVQVARALARSGIASLRFDFRGSGDSAGEFHEMSVSSLCADARASLAWVAARSEVDPARIGILGMSLGGMVASLLSHEYETIKTAVLWCPVTNPKRLIEMRSTPLGQKQLDETGITDLGGWAVGRRFIEEMVAVEPFAALRRAKFPLLFVHGDADETVPIEHTLDTIGKLATDSRDVSLHRIAGAGHCYESLPWVEDVVGTTREWFSRML